MSASKDFADILARFPVAAVEEAIEASRLRYDRDYVFDAVAAGEIAARYAAKGAPQTEAPSRDDPDYPSGPF